jgi:hypothetical protein
MIYFLIFYNIADDEQENNVVIIENTLEFSATCQKNNEQEEVFNVITLKGIISLLKG